MTELTDSEVKALLDGATPGPWAADGDPQNRIIWSPDGNRVCFMAHSSGMNDARDIATSNLVAAAPDLARALLDARAERDDAFAAGVVHGQKALRAITGPLQVVDSPELAELRAELDRVKAERDCLAAANAVLEAKVAGLVGADVWYRLTWTAAPRPPVHPTAMTGRQNFDTLEKATAFFKRLASDAEFVSMTKFVMVQLDVSDEARAALATQEAGK